MKKAHLIKSALTMLALVAVPALTAFGVISESTTSEISMQQVTPAERDAVKQLLLAFQTATEKAAGDYATIGDLRASVSEVSQIDVFGCPMPVRESFTQLSNTYARHFLLLDEVFKAAGLDDSTLLRDTQEACKDPRILESAAKMQEAIIVFVNSLVPYLSGGTPAY